MLKKHYRNYYGTVYNKTQRRLANKCCARDDLLFKPKSLTQKRLDERYKNSKHVPSTEFGKKYNEHYGYGPSKNMAQYMREKRLYKLLGKASWE
jgi:hypothetical protein